MRTRRFLLAVVLGICSASVWAEADYPLELQKITIKVIDVHMQEGIADLGYSTIRKVCVDGQAYLLLLSPKGIVGLSASFRDGKPEQCTFLPDGSAISLK